MDFPQESIDEAKWIAGKYRTRYDTPYTKARALYRGKFIDSLYGFDTALKTGVVGTYLHELEKDTECFSFCGINYVTARELNLKPRIYQATDMRDYFEGQNPENHIPGNHTFITVEIKGKTYILDPNMSVFDECEFKPTHVEIDAEHNGIDQTKIRDYSSLRELSVTEYLTELERFRTKDHAKEMLINGQAVHEKKTRFTVEYSPNAHSLSSRIHFSIYPPNLIEDSPRKVVVFEADAPISNDGSWDVSKGILNTWNSRTSAWKKSQHAFQLMKFSTPFGVILEYAENLQSAAKYHGRKTSLFKARGGNMFHLAEKYGFNRWGEIFLSNGVSAKSHNVLLDQIVNSLDVGTNDPLVLAHLAQEANYSLEAKRIFSPQNTTCLLFSEDERMQFLDEGIKSIRNNLDTLIGKHMLTILAKAGLKGKSKKVEKDLAMHLNKEDVPEKRVGLLLEHRKKFLNPFNQALDFALYQKMHPLGEKELTDEALDVFARATAHNSYISACALIDKIGLPSYKKGIKKIFSQE